MEINHHIVIEAEGYDRVDGRNAYCSDIKRLTLGTPMSEENKNMQIALQVWKEKTDGSQYVSMEIPIHHLIDFMLLLSRTMLYFREAYRFPLLYNPDNPVLERMGIQGDVLPITAVSYTHLRPGPYSRWAGYKRCQFRGWGRYFSIRLLRRSSRLHTERPHGANQ